MADVKNDGGAAFPRPYSSPNNGTFANPQAGMSLRDWFAGQALVGMCANPEMGKIINWLIYAAAGKEQSLNGVAETAYEMADAMLAERAKQ